MHIPAITLRKDLTRWLRGGHPWVYRDAIRPARQPTGAWVMVRQGNGRPLAWGFWDARSPIAVRVLDRRPVEDPQALVRERLRAALDRRLALLDRRLTNAFRWVHGEADGLPGIHVDLYDDMAAVRYDGEGARAFYRELPEALRDAGGELGVREVVDRDRRGRAPEREVRENGLHFLVDLAHGQKGGLFLDQRDNRAEVGRRAGGRSVLNLFGYTGGFSVYAAAKGASRTDTVDLARPALDAARKNFALNGLTLERAGFHAQDAFDFLSAAASRRESWQVLVCDPPSFAPSQRALPAARRAYRRLHRMAAAVISPGGLFCPASCSSHFDRNEFLASVIDGVRQAGRRFTLEALRGAGPDHPVTPSFPEGDYLKFALGRVD